MIFKEQNTSNISSTLETIQINTIGNKDYFYDLKLNSLSDSFSNQSQIQNFEECMQDFSISALPEKSLLNRQMDGPSKSKFSNLKENGENEDKLSDITEIKPQKKKKKPKKVNFLVRKTNFLRSGNTTIRKSHRSSNFKNRILRNLIHDIFIDWISTQSNKRINKKNIRKLKKLSQNYLQVIYKEYINMDKFTLKEIYSGDFFKQILEKDKHIFEFNKKAMETSACMEPKLNCTFKQAFNYFYNKEKIISCQNGDILNGLKSKNEYINEKREKEFLEKYMKELYDNINH
jgi:hypothetical protein